MTAQLSRELTQEETPELNGGGCAAIGAAIAALALTENWAGVAGMILAAYHYGCFNNW
jgi:hypothetical protein